MSSENIFLITFWVSATLLFYTFAGYPLLSFVLSKLRRVPCQKHNFSTLPAVSVVLVVHNEADKIKQKIENLLASDYPSDLLEIVVASDGSTDKTDEIVESFNNPNVKLIRLKRRSGKPTGINTALNLCSGEIIVFCDARQRFAPDTIRKLIGHFSDSKAGAVSGALEIDPSSSAVGTGVDLYWKIEKMLRSSEALIDSCIGCTGAVYAIRKELFEPLPPDTILDDVVIPMRIALKGFRIIYDNSALAYDPQPLEPEKEKIRKQRTLAGNFQMLFRYPQWLIPFKNRLFWQLISHKYLRLAGPFLLLAIFLSNIPLLSMPFYKITFGAQILFYLFAAVGLVFKNTRLKIFSIPAGFLFLNLQVITGFVYYLKNKNPQTWNSANTD
ncbi:MAG: glycosyltransferase family 2 protein [Verrucomicrobiia bacterium]